MIRSQDSCQRPLEEGRTGEEGGAAEVEMVGGGVGAELGRGAGVERGGASRGESRDQERGRGRERSRERGDQDPGQRNQSLDQGHGGQSREKGNPLRERKAAVARKRGRAAAKLRARLMKKAKTFSTTMSSPSGWTIS